MHLTNIFINREWYIESPKRKGYLFSRYTLIQKGKIIPLKIDWLSYLICVEYLPIIRTGHELFSDFGIPASSI